MKYCYPVLDDTNEETSTQLSEILDRLEHAGDNASSGSGDGDSGDRDEGTKARPIGRLLLGSLRPKHVLRLQIRMDKLEQRLQAGLQHSGRYIHSTAPG